MFSTALYELCLAFRFDILTEGRGDIFVECLYIAYLQCCVTKQLE